ncbi:HepT-like ribonuclease domain-containing protein, partial [Bacillus pumilus]|uniref:HepT-like ribonuclease domain-containing protein n=1 Tax=Bacillus pumilus TaxID=1408 RepID=UPI0021B417EA
EERLGFLEEEYELMERDETWRSGVEKKGVEGIVDLVVECIVDRGNEMIDGFIMGDGGRYDEIMDIVVDEKVVAEEEGSEVKKVVWWGKRVVEE